MPTINPSHAWAAVSALSNFGLLIVAAFGLRQLSLAKQGLQQSAKIARKAALRESYRLAADQCRHYMNDIVPLIDSCDQKMNACGLTAILGTFTVHVSDNGIEVKPPNPLPANLFEVFSSERAIYATLPIHNALESFAVMFTNGVAAEEVAFGSIGRTFCFNIRKHAPLLIPLAGTGAYPGTGYFQNALRLFCLWQRRIDTQELLDQQDAIKKQLAGTQNVTIKPIGT